MRRLRLGEETRRGGKPSFDASLLRRSRFGPPAASAQPPHPPCAAMVGIGGCCEGTLCRLDAALPSLCQQIPIGAVRLGPCHPRCLSAFRYMPAKLVHQVHECSPSAIEANSREGAGASNSGSVPCISRRAHAAAFHFSNSIASLFAPSPHGWLLQSGDINRLDRGMPRPRRSGPGHLVACVAAGPGGGDGGVQGELGARAIMTKKKQRTAQTMPSARTQTIRGAVRAQD